MELFLTREAFCVSQSRQWVCCRVRWIQRGRVHFPNDGDHDDHSTATYRALSRNLRFQLEPDDPPEHVPEKPTLLGPHRFNVSARFPRSRFDDSTRRTFRSLCFLTPQERYDLIVTVLFSHNRSTPAEVVFQIHIGAGFHQQPNGGFVAA